LEQQSEIEKSKVVELEQAKAELEAQLKLKDSILSQQQQEMEVIKQQFFFSCAIALKMSATMAGQSCNVNVNQLYEEILEENVALKDWNGWIAERIIAATSEPAPPSPSPEPKKRAAVEQVSQPASKRTQKVSPVKKGKASRK
jgi:hypothetical protein